MPGGIALTFEATEIGGGDGERAVIEELAHGLDRLADVATELGGGVAEDVNARGRQAGQAEIAPEAVVEGSAGDALGACTRLPERLGGLHGREVLADITKRSAYRRERGAGEFTAAAQTALAEIAVEGGGVVEGDIAGCEVDDLRPASAGEDESEDDGEVAPALEGIGDDLEELLHLRSGEAAWCAGTGLGALDGIAGIGPHDIHADEELEEGRDTGETSADGYWRRFTARKADAVGEREDVSGSDLVGRLSGGQPKKWRRVR